MKLIEVFFSFVCLVFLSACGGGGGSGGGESGDSGGANDAFDGVYVGTVSLGEESNPIDVAVLLGRIMVLDLETDEITDGSFTSSGDTVSGSGDYYDEFGERAGSFSFTGSVDENRSISGQYTIDGQVAQFDIDYDPTTSESGATLSDLAGNYAETNNAALLMSVDESGNFSIGDGDCAATGVISQPSDINVFRISIQSANAACGVGSSYSGLLSLTSDGALFFTAADGEIAELLIFEPS